MLELCRRAFELPSHGAHLLADCGPLHRRAHALWRPGAYARAPMLRDAPARDQDGIRSVVDGLRRIFRELRLSARGAERGAGISGAQLFVLQSLAQGSAASLNELADRTLTDQSSVSVVVKRLVTRGMVARKA